MHLFPDQVPAGTALREGAVYQVLVNAYERNPTARRRCIEHYGTNCHAMLHRRDPPFEIAELKAMIRPRQGWDAALRNMAERGDGARIDS